MKQIEQIGINELNNIVSETFFTNTDDIELSGIGNDLSISSDTITVDNGVYDSFYIGDTLDDINYIGDPIPYWNNPYWNYPSINYPYIINYPVINTFNYVLSSPKYSVFKLPRTQMPKKVFLNGRLVSLGKIGDDVQAAYDGKNKLIFAPSELTAICINDKITIAVEYDDCMYHYNIKHSNHILEYKKNSNILKASRVSEIAQ